MTPRCYRRLLDEREHLVNVERPGIVNVVSWAASNGDRSEMVTTSTAKDVCVKLTAAYVF